VLVLLMAPVVLAPLVRATLVLATTKQAARMVGMCKVMVIAEGPGVVAVAELGAVRVVEAQPLG
jgi:hypothetical protein